MYSVYTVESRDYAPHVVCSCGYRFTWLMVYNVCILQSEGGAGLICEIKLPMQELECQGGGYARGRGHVAICILLCLILSFFLSFAYQTAGESTRDYTLSFKDNV